MPFKDKILSADLLHENIAMQVCFNKGRVLSYKKGDQEDLPVPKEEVTLMGYIEGVFGPDHRIDNMEDKIGFLRFIVILREKIYRIELVTHEMILSDKIDEMREETRSLVESTGIVVLSIRDITQDEETIEGLEKDSIAPRNHPVSVITADVNEKGEIENRKIYTIPKDLEAELDELDKKEPTYDPDIDQKGIFLNKIMEAAWEAQEEQTCTIPTESNNVYCYTIKPILEENAVCAHAHDVTELRATKESLKEAICRAEMYMSAPRSNPSAVGIYDHDGNFIDGSDLGKELNKIYKGPRAVEFMRDLKRVLKNKDSATLDSVEINGRIYLPTMVPNLVVEEGRWYVSVFSKDITEIVEKTRELEDTKTELADVKAREQKKDAYIQKLEGLAQVRKDNP